MAIPRPISDWLAGQWKLDNTDTFWNMVPEGKGEILTLYKADSWIQEKSPKPEQSVRALHEIAHLIICEDKDVLDPLYGLKHWASSILPPDEFKVEFEVCCLAYLLGNHCTRHNCRSSPPTSFIFSKYTTLSSTEVNALLPAIYAKWTVDKAWTELHRKYRLITDLQLLKKKGANPLTNMALLMEITIATQPQEKPSGQPIQQSATATAKLANPRRYSWPTQHNSHRQVGRPKRHHYHHTGR
jgi:hypothetical protein